MRMLALLAAAFMLTAAGQEEAINSKCPVSGKPAKASKTVEYKGKTLGFCCGFCIKKFNKDPESYVADMPEFKTQEAKTAELGKVVPDFKLKTVDGKKEISLSDFRTKGEKKGR